MELNQTATMVLSKSQKLIYTIVHKMGLVEDKTKLAKLEHYVDFIHYAFHDRPISEDTYLYQKRKQGPLAVRFNNDLSALKDAGLIEENPKYHYKVKRSVAIKWDREDEKTIDFVIKKYGRYSYQDLINLSHRQMPYLNQKFYLR